jgi:hypothetical protein
LTHDRNATLGDLIDVALATPEACALWWALNIDSKHHHGAQSSRTENHGGRKMAKAKVKTKVKCNLVPTEHDFANRVIQTLDLFEDGKRVYKSFGPMPKPPTDDDADAPDSFRFYGYMIARGNEVQAIIEQIRQLELSEKKHNALMTKRVNALDSAHAVNGKSKLPIW